MTCAATVVLFAALTFLIEPSSQFNKPCSDGPVDIVFILDSSDSIWQSDFDLQLEFVGGVVDLLPVGPGDLDFRVGLVTFSHKVRLQFHLGYYKDKYAVKRAILRVPYLGGGTYTGDAIKYVSNTMFQERHGARESAADIIVVITDGLSQNTTATAVEASLARYHGVELYVIGVGPGVDQNELLSIASNPDDQYLFRVDDFPSLHGIRDNLASKACGPRPQRDPALPDGPEIILPPKPPQILPPMQQDQPCNRNSRTEVIFAFNQNDLSADESEILLDYVSDLAEDLNIAPDSTRVGLFLNDLPLTTAIHVSKYTNVQAFVEYVGRMRVPKMAHLLQKIRRHSFSDGRDNVPKLVVLFVRNELDKHRHALREAHRLKRDDVELIVVAIGNEIDPHNLAALCSAPTQHHLVEAASFDKLWDVKNEISQRLCDGEYRR